MLEGVDGVAASAAGEIDAPPVAVVFLGFRRSDVEHPLDGLGLLAPSCEKRALLGAQFCSTMFPARAQDGHVALAAYIGGARSPDLARLPASKLIELARAEFRELIGARGEPAVARVRHWPRGLPQYRPGHEQRRQDIMELPERQPGLFITGNYIAGPSVAVCLEQAEETAGRTARFLALAQKHVYTPGQISRTG
jgi:oxygen-dependent protoporphyrinogen oxidase